VFRKKVQQVETQKKIWQISREPHRGSVFISGFLFINNFYHAIISFFATKAHKRYKLMAQHHSFVFASTLFTLFDNSMVDVDMFEESRRNYS
jgi:hypothetical protein